MKTLISIVAVLALGLLTTQSVTAGARMYDPNTGRFMSMDPGLEGVALVNQNFGVNAFYETIDRIPRRGGHTLDFNRYNYGRNDPLRYTDPTGNLVVDATEGGNVQRNLSSTASGAQMYNRLQSSSNVYVFTNQDLSVVNASGQTWFTNSNTISIQIDPNTGNRPDTLYHEATHAIQFESGLAPTNSSYSPQLFRIGEGRAYATENNAYGLGGSCPR